MTATTTTRGRARKALPPIPTEAEALAMFESGDGFVLNVERSRNLRAMQRAREAVERAQADLNATVRESLWTGSTTADVGTALRISQQAASKRYPKATAS